MSAVHPFFESINLLRSKEEIIIYSGMHPIKPDEESMVEAMLEMEYKNESLNYPFIAPAFDPAAAVWAARIVYNASQLLLNRDKMSKDAVELILPFTGNYTPSVILSADLTLRFMPQIISEGHFINPDDPVILVVTEIMEKWPYSNVSQVSKINPENLEVLNSNDCLCQLFIDRVIRTKSIKFLEIPWIKEHVNATIGNYKKYFWAEL